VVNPNNFECLHYPDPQTGQAPNPQPYTSDTTADCPAAPSHGAPPVNIPEFGVGFGRGPAATAVLLAGLMGAALLRRRRRWATPRG
jgi:hypothetical protein